MDNLNNLLIILKNQSSALEQVASRCGRFGMDAIYKNRSNRACLEIQIGNVLAAIKLISENSKLDPDCILAAADAGLIALPSEVKKIPRKRINRKQK